MAVAVNPTQVAQDNNLISMIFNQPYIYIVISLVIILFIVMKLKGNQRRPEQKPFYGIDVREGMTHKELKRRVNSFGYKPNLILYKGFLRAGKILKLESVMRKTVIKKGKGFGKAEELEVESYLFSYRKFGFVAWLKALMGRFDFMVVSPEAASVDFRKKQLMINPNSYFSNEAGVWVQSKKEQIDLIDTINLQQDLTNVKGHLSDFPRRVSNLDPNHAKDTGMVSHVFAEKEKEKRARVSRWEGG